MYRILRKEALSTTVHLFEVDVPAVARKAHAGQFVVVRADEKGERIPLTIADWDARKGNVTLVFMEVGRETSILATLQSGDGIANLIGPLGRPSEIENFGTVICVGGGVGIAPVMPIARALKETGNRVITILGARTKDLLFWEERLRRYSDKTIVTTDDGSYACKGLVTEPLKEILEKDKAVKRVIAIGPAIMMKFCSLTTKPFGVKTVVSLNPIMVDGTGMCGCCRVEIVGKTKFACVDGPEFDGHEVDWNLLMNRQHMYLDKEKEAMELWEHQVKSCRR